MPCNADHMQANELEIEVGRLTLLHREVTEGKPFTPDQWDSAGYLEGVYGKGLSRVTANRLTRDLCEYLSGDVDPAVFSLELQLWWRNHQEADKKKARQRKKAKQRKTAKQRKAIKLKALLAKLSEEEKELLGIK